MIQKTPFKPGEIYSTNQIQANEGPGSNVTQWIARRDHVDAIRSRLAGLGFHVRRVNVANIATAPLADFSAEIAPNNKIWRRINGLLLVGIIATISAWQLIPSWNAFQMLKQQETGNAALSNQAVALRQQFDGMQDSASMRSDFITRVTSSQTISSLLRDLTVILPDTVWLTDISIQTGRVIIRGSISGSAAELVLSLTRDGQFIAPRLTGPVSQTADGRERFDMTLDFKESGI
ncbi:PilN domain-containing protein [Litoreibacter sp.]|nr:PilN domain-containing protein [Litoreibacter sp.]